MRVPAGYLRHVRLQGHRRRDRPERRVSSDSAQHPREGEGHALAALFIDYQSTGRRHAGRRAQVQVYMFDATIGRGIAVNRDQGRAAVRATP